MERLCHQQLREKRIAVKRHCHHNHFVENKE
ncbi:hypothetical protein [Paenibacillus odorifer]